MTIDEAIDIAGRLAKHLREAKAIQPLLAKDADAIDTIIVELDRLRSALPRTADGVRVAPKQTVYVRLEDGSGIGKDFVRCCLGTYDAYEVDEAFSSRAAARAAALDAGRGK